MIKIIKKIFKLYDQKDIETAIINIGHAKDREDYEWKLRNLLFKK